MGAILFAQVICADARAQIEIRKENKIACFFIKINIMKDGLVCFGTNITFFRIYSKKSKNNLNHFKKCWHWKSASQERLYVVIYGLNGNGFLIKK